VKPYTRADAARILKVSTSRLRYWERIALVKLRGELGTSAGFEFRDLVCLKAILSLLDHGVPVRRIRRSVELLRRAMPDLDQPAAALHWADEVGRVVVERDGVLSEPEGQMMFDFREEKDASDTPRALELREPIAPGEASEGEGEAALDWFERGCGLDGSVETFPDAIRAYERALELDPSFADAYCNLGAIYYNLTKRDQAADCFERCLEIDSGHVEAHFNLGNLLEEKGHPEAAVRHLRAALEADPFYADLHVNLGLLYEKLGLSRKAREHWRRYLQLESRGSWAEVARKRLHRHPGDPGEA